MDSVWCCRFVLPVYFLCAVWGVWLLAVGNLRAFLGCLYVLLWGKGVHLWWLLRAGFWFALSSTDKKVGTCLIFFISSQLWKHMSQGVACNGDSYVSGM